MPNTKNNDELNARLSELESEIIHLKKELKTKVKYGLVFERKSEKVVEECETKLPVLKEVIGKKIETDKTKPTNIIIEGDNYQSLQVLNYTHQGKIDLIYIDPPYNTGNKDFIYNDNFVDREDSFRHSKWLSFMEKRLLLARDLLSEIGVIFISIDDNEGAQLKLLCDSIFGENNFIAQIIWLNKEGGGGSDSKNYKIKHEYILCYSRFIEKSLIKGIKSEENESYSFEDKYINERGRYKLIKLNSFSIQYSKSLDYPILVKDGTNVSPSENGRQGCWRWSKKKYQWGLENDFIVSKKLKDNSWVIYTKQYFKVDNENKPIVRSLPPVAVIEEFSSTMATKQLEQVFREKVFDYSKPYLLIKRLLEHSSDLNNIVLDFFAGSGTTGHAVLELNKEDGGNRQFILCTNNGDEKSEHKIASDICYPRIQKVIEGYTNKKGEKVDGLGGNLRYLKTAFIDKKKNKDEMKFKITRASTELLCLKEGAFEIIEEVGDEYNPVYTIVRGSGVNGEKVMGIYFDIDDSKLEEMRKKLLKCNAEKVAYIFTLNDENLDIEHNDWLNIKIESIPEKILNAYQYAYKLTKK